jgi:hypothetical protein
MLAWRLVVFNDLKGNDIHRGDVVLVPLDDLKLTPKGEAEAAIDRQIEISGSALERQKKIEEILPELNRLVADARFVEAVALGERLRGMGDATRSQLAKIGKRLTVAYVALDAPGAAADACKLYLDHARVVHLEPETTSPKIRAACGQK